MGYVIGTLLALLVGLFGTFVGLDRERGFYPVVTIVVASYWVLFAIMGASTPTLILELVVGSAFVLSGVVGFTRSLWFAVAGLAGHGVFDVFHDALYPNPGAPPFWPAFCASYDVVAGAYLAVLIRNGRVKA
ncbi:MAG TPA: hypothetical protein VJ623_10055 [Holophagaceae bacterium]|nr:hypothetical protein [Holophagaceae bacterium]